VLSSHASASHTSISTPIRASFVATLPPMGSRTNYHA
jgi:hypothetical protein